MKLYHCANARSFRVLWTLEEMGLEYDLVNMQFPPRTEYPGYLDVNPLGTVPAFVDQGVTMTESSGICHYLVERYGPTDLALEVDHPEYGTYLNWLYRSDATLTFPQTLVLRYTLQEPAERRVQQVADDYTAWFFSRARSIETTLSDGRTYLTGNRFTIADIAVHYALLLAQQLNLDGHFKANTAKYFEHHMQRDSFVKAQSKQK